MKINNNLTEKPLKFHHALLLLIAVASTFYASYGLSNYLASQKSHVAEIFFEWEKSIPFLPWTIVPYWSLNLFYGLAFFLCRSRAEIRCYVKQLLSAQIVAVLCFLLFPLQFSWEKPETHGLSAFFFDSLATFDQPYNQAPSLHIALSVIVGRFYWQRLTGIWRMAWAVWVSLIAISVLTTYQHHFIDIPTGLLLGLLAVWMLPAPKRCIFEGWHGKLKSSKRHQRWTAFYLALALGFAVLANCWSPMSWWLFYPAVSCVLVALAYAFWGVSILQKQASGRLSVAATVLLLPYLFGVRLNIYFWLRGKAKSHHILDNIHVGSITVAKDFARVIDVCAEYPCLANVAHYHSQSLLDMVEPDPNLLEQIADAIEQQHQHGEPVLVCCALGYGRSVAAVLTWLVRYRHCPNWAAAVALVKKSHPNMVLLSSID